MKIYFLRLWPRSRLAYYVLAGYRQIHAQSEAEHQVHDIGNIHQRLFLPRRDFLSIHIIGKDLACVTNHVASIIDASE